MARHAVAQRGRPAERLIRYANRPGLSQAEQAGAGLALLIQGPLIPLKADREADTAELLARAALAGKAPEECRFQLLKLRNEWLCPLPSSELDVRPFNERVEEYRRCYDAWWDDLTADDRALFNAAFAKSNDEAKVKAAADAKAAAEAKLAAEAIPVAKTVPNDPWPARTKATAKR